LFNRGRPCAVLIFWRCGILKPSAPVMTEICSRKRFSLQAGNRTLELGERTLVMGILNVTPDSFSDKGKFFDPKAAVERAWQIASEGADILDIGGESTRPGSQSISTDEELRRVIPILEVIVSGRDFPIPISIDTSKAEVAKAALEHGAAIINDVTSLQGDIRTGAVAARYGAGLVLMHMRGRPSNMQLIPPSPDILNEVDVWAHEAVARAESCGVSRDRIMLDPGIGFGKTAAQNFELLRNLGRLGTAGFPLLVGTSRKSFIGSVLRKPAGELVLGTCATVAAAIIFGAHVVRVHDVGAAREVADVTDAIVKAGPQR
jgi:dihydropteroate synthase